MNGTTSTERTNYFQAVPANQLPLTLWLESDRMRSLAVTEENLTNQRNAVQEEKRLNYDNQPYGEVFNLLNSMIYKNFSNSHSTIGSMADLDAATVDDIKEFFRIYYAPNNAVLTISGAFEPKETKALLKSILVRSKNNRNQKRSTSKNRKKSPKLIKNTKTSSRLFRHL